MARLEHEKRKSTIMKWKLAIVRWAILSLLPTAGAAFADQLGPYTPGPARIEKQVKAAAKFKLQDTLPPAKSIRLETLPAADKAQLKHNNSSRQEKATQVGIGRVVPPASAAAVKSAALGWQTLTTGGQAAAFTVTSPGAVAMRIGLKVTRLPAGAEFRFAGSGNLAEVLGPVSAERSMRNPVYWSPVVQGETVTVEVYLPPGTSAGDADFSVSAVSHLVTSPVQPDSASLMEQSTSTSCNLEQDAVCYYGTAAIQNTANSVARMEFTESDGNGYLCTGTLLNSLVQNTPYFWTANHCISDATTANTLNTFWFYQSSVCNGSIPNLGYVTLYDGASLLYHDSTYDGSLLLLNDATPSGATYSGWNATAIPLNAGMIDLHHPMGDFKKISLGNYVGLNTWNGVGSYSQVTWTKGITEGGSSGSGLFVLNSAGQYELRGGLRGGTVNCTSPYGYDLYSRLDLAYPSIKQWIFNAVPPANIVSGSIQAITATSAILSVTANAATTAYYVVLPSSAPQPSTSQVLAGTDAYNVKANSGQWALPANIATGTNLTGLSSNTSYDVYVAAQDANGGITNAQYLPFTTLAGHAVQTDIRTYVPYAAATGGYESFLRVINTGSVASPITVARIDGQTGVVQSQGTLVASLGAGASTTFTAKQVETAMGMMMAASDRPRIRVGATNTTISAQSFLLQPGGVFNEVSPAQTGSTIVVPTYIPAAAAPTGYESYLRVINTGSVATAVTIARTDPTTGLTGTPATLINSLPAGAAMSFVGSQIETALGLTLSASDRPQMLVTGASSTLDAQSFFIQPGGAFTDVSSSQSGSTVKVRTYVPAAASGYTTYLKIINNSNTAAAVTATVIDGPTGVPGASGILLPSLAANAGVTLTSAQVETALGVSLPALSRPRLSLTSPANLTVQSFLLQPGGAFNEVSGAQTGPSITVETYIPAADAVTGYTSYLRVINTGQASVPVTAALIDPVTGQTGTPATLVASLPPQAALSFSPSQVETALGITIPQGSRPRIIINGDGVTVLEVQSFLIQPGGVFTNVSGGQ